MRGVTEVGYYSLIIKGVLLINLIPSLIMVALFPHLSANVNDKEKIKKLTKKVLLSFIGLGLLISILVFFLAPIIPFFVGQSYEPSVGLTQFLIWIIIFMFPSAYFTYFYLAHNKQILNFYLTAICAIINLVLNFILIPKFGMYGAAATSIFAQFLNFILLLIFSKKVIQSPIDVSISNQS